MSTPIATLTSGAAGEAPCRSLPRIYLLEAWYEFLKLMRLPAYSIPTVTFPVLFYVFFGLSFNSGAANRVEVATYLLATYGAFGVIGAALFGFGVGVAVERGQGWMLLKRASPMPPGAYFAAKITLSLLFGTVIVCLLYTLGALFGGVSMPPASWALLALVHIAGALPFCAMGLALGYLCGPNSAPAVVNLIYLPMAFASGLWLPIRMLPGFFRTLAPALPPYHYSQLALKVVGADSGGSVAAHLSFLAGFTVFCLALAWIGYRRDEGKTYG